MVKIKYQRFILFFLIFAVAILLRIGLSSGIEGSDDVVYLTQAYKIATGEYEIPIYIAHLRIATIFPIALIFKIFGPNSFTIYLWSLIASLINIIIIYKISHLLFDEKTAILSAICAVFYPLDIHMAGQALVETSLALMLSVSVLFYLKGFKSKDPNKSSTYNIICGIFIGLAALNKHPAIFIILFFVIHIIINKHSFFNLFYILLGGFMIFLIENIYWYFISGDPLFLYHMYLEVIVVNRQLTIQGGNLPLTYYLYYTLISIQHVGLYYYLSLFGLTYIFLKKSNIDTNNFTGVKFLLMWGLSLMFIMTFLPISIRPLLFIHKQTNYMMMFSMPFVILGGYSLSLIKKRAIQYAVIIILCSMSVFSAYIQRNTVKSHGYNTEAALKYIVKYPGTLLLTGEYNTHYFMVYNMINEQKIEYYFFDQIINGKIDKSSYRYQRKPNDDQRFINAIKNHEKVLILYDYRMAKRQRGYYYPDPIILNKPESGLKLIAAIKKDKTQLEEVIEVIVNRIVKFMRQHGFAITYAKKLENLMQDTFYPDPAFIYIK